MPYETWLQANAPTYMADVYGLAWLGGIGAAMDDYVTLYTAGAMAAFPDYAPADALPVLGDEFGLDQGPSESSVSYAARLVGAWTAWKYAGTPIGLLAGLYWAGFPGGVLVQQNGLAYNLSGALVAGADPRGELVVTECSTLSVALTSNVTPPTTQQAGRQIPSGNSWWAFDSNTDFCSRFAVLFPTPPALYPFAAGDLTRLKATILKWKPAKATLVGVYICTAGKFMGWPVQTQATNTMGAATIVRVLGD